MTGGAVNPACVVFALLSLGYSGASRLAGAAAPQSPAMAGPGGCRRRFRCCGLRFRPMLAVTVRIGHGSDVSAGVLAAIVVRACGQLTARCGRGLLVPPCTAVGIRGGVCPVVGVRREGLTPGCWLLVSPRVPCASCFSLGRGGGPAARPQPPTPPTAPFPSPSRLSRDRPCRSRFLTK